MKNSLLVEVTYDKINLLAQIKLKFERENNIFIFMWDASM